MFRTGFLLGLLVCGGVFAEAAVCTSGTCGQGMVCANGRCNLPSNEFVDSSAQGTGTVVLGSPITASVPVNNPPVCYGPNCQAGGQTGFMSVPANTIPDLTPSMVPVQGQQYRVNGQVITMGQVGSTPTSGGAPVATADTKSYDEDGNKVASKPRSSSSAGANANPTASSAPKMFKDQNGDLLYRLDNGSYSRIYYKDDKFQVADKGNGYRELEKTELAAISKGLSGDEFKDAHTTDALKHTVKPLHEALKEHAPVEVAADDSTEADSDSAEENLAPASERRSRYTDLLPTIGRGNHWEAEFQSGDYTESIRKAREESKRSESPLVVKPVPEVVTEEVPTGEELVRANLRQHQQNDF